MWQNWVNLVLGIWVIIVPFTGMSEGAMTIVLFVTGAVIALVALSGVGTRRVMTQG